VTSRPASPALRGLRAGFAVLTRIPVGGFPYSDDAWQWSAAYFPLVGAVLGALAGGIWQVTLRAGYLVASAIAIATLVLLTGALHEDGLADTADALGGGTNRERVLEILKDSRIGSFGGTALTLSLVVRIALLARLGASACVALVLAGSVSRLAPVWLSASLPYVTDPNVAKSRAIMSAGRPQVVVATSWGIALCAALLASGTLHAVDIALTAASSVVVALVCGIRFHARVGGVTGDFLGAAQQVSECAILLALALLRGGTA
jgi:adenosylcobinamide-GDP ribazoletransferase